MKKQKNKFLLNFLNTFDSLFKFGDKYYYENERGYYSRMVAKGFYFISLITFLGVVAFNLIMTNFSMDKSVLFPFTITMIGASLISFIVGSFFLFVSYMFKFLPLGVSYKEYLKMVIRFYFSIMSYYIILIFGMVFIGSMSASLLESDLDYDFEVEKYENSIIVFNDALDKVIYALISVTHIFIAITIIYNFMKYVLGRKVS